jgi:hypothetical protein
MECASFGLSSRVETNSSAKVNELALSGFAFYMLYLALQAQ